MNDIKSVCVFASSSNHIDKIYFESAKELGELLAKEGYSVVFGGSNLGLMGEVTKAAYNLGSHITGVMPEKLHNLGIKEGYCTDFIITKGMRERKAKMDELSQAIIALPGGFGTLEELSEMLTQKQLNYSNKPIVLLNTNNYYSKLVEFFQIIMREKFASRENKDIYYIAKTPKDAIKYIKNYEYKNINYLKDKVLAQVEKV